MLLIHADDAYRRALIKALDERNFSVTYTDDEEAATRALGEKSFTVIILAAERAALVEQTERVGAALIVVGDAGVELRKVADETLLKPVDPTYLAGRARAYCNC